ncbi:MAG: hypothetical protein AAF089_18385 [Bacteroidota bacterium]
MSRSTNPPAMGDGQNSVAPTPSTPAGDAAVPQHAPPPPASEGSQNIDRIRDILFGNQMEAYEARFLRLEERLAGEMDTLRAELRRRFDSLETFVKDEVTSLGQRLTEEHGARSEGDEALAELLRSKNDALTKRVAEYREAAAAAERDLRQQLLEQATRAADDLRDQTEQTQRALQQHVTDLSSRKTDRAALATLFSELAFRISGTDE